MRVKLKVISKNSDEYELNNSIEAIYNMDRILKQSENKGWRDVMQQLDNEKENGLNDNTIISAEVTRTGIDVFYFYNDKKNWLATFDYDAIGKAIDINCLNADEKEANFKSTLVLDAKSQKIYGLQKTLNELKQKKRRMAEDIETIDSVIMDIMNNINTLVSEE